MPDENTVGLQHAREFPNHLCVVARMRKESERREEIEHGVEASLPARRHLAHVAAGVSQIWTDAALAGDSQQIIRVVETIDIESGLRQQMRVPALATRDVENARSRRQSQKLDEPRSLLAIALEGKKRAVLQQIVSVERGLPPLFRFLQKNTGSRYAPNTVSIAARIS